LRKAQDRAEKGRPYSDKMNVIITNLKNSITDIDSAPKLLVGNKKSQKHLCIVMTADRGLCGGFNTNICRRARLFFNEVLESGKELKIITIGSKGHDQIKRVFGKYVIDKISFKDLKQISINESDEVTTKVIDMFNRDEFDVCTIFYNKFKSIMSQEPQAQQVIPILSTTKENLQEEGSVNQSQYEYEPDQEEILENLLPKNISTQIFKAFLENAASEQGSRMSAMDSATRNAGDLINKLTINYNRSRQAVITKELIEIISGAESL
jgi:F-type H+-transporting ATPase subunit gamma